MNARIDLETGRQTVTTIEYDPKFMLHLFQYMAWGDEMGLAAARAVRDEEYYKPRGFSAGSIHNLLVHQMVSQKIWLGRWNGVNATRMEDQTDHPTRELLEERWPRVRRELLDFAGRQTAESLAAVTAVRRTTGEPLALPLGAMMMHLADHGNYHRGQLNSMLKFAGAATAYPAYYRYFMQTQARPT